MDERRCPHVLIVGGLGYFGSRLAAALGNQSDVLVTSRSLSAEREQWLRATAGTINRVQFDSAEHQNLPTGESFDCIINVASPSAAEVARATDLIREHALRTIRACLDLMKAGRAARLIHFSSFHVYGSHHQTRFSEEDIPEPTHPYGEVHLQCERAIADESDGLPVFIVRPTNIVGAPAHADLGPQSALVFLDLCRQAIETQRLSLRSNGKAYRDFVTMKDAIEAVRKLLSAPGSTTPSGGLTLNLASGTAHPLEELAKQIQLEANRLKGYQVAINFGSGQDSFSEPFRVANDRLRTLGWQPRNDLRGEIRQTLEFFTSVSAI